MPAKKVKGRKRHIVVDTQGGLRAVVVHPADIQDRDGAKLVLQRMAGLFPDLRLRWADSGYAGALQTWVAEPTPENTLVKGVPEGTMLGAGHRA